MPLRKRPPGENQTGRQRRQLVRWDADLDVHLLLSIQQSCNAAGIKIPWQQVADTMGPKFTEGAIIQHLSKLRGRRASEGKPVPPPLKRSVPTGGSGVRKLAKNSGPKKDTANAEKTEEDLDEVEASVRTSEEDDPSWSQSGNKKRKRVKPHRKFKGYKANTPEEDTVDTGELRCVGAPFLELKGDTDTDSFPDSESGQDEESIDGDGSVSIKQEQKIVSLHVSPKALQRLESSGSVKCPPTSELTPDLTPGNTTSQPLFSSPTPHWGGPQRAPLSQYQSGFRPAHPTFPSGYTDLTYGQMFSNQPNPFFPNSSHYPGRQNMTNMQTPVMGHHALHNVLDPELFNEANRQGWMSAPVPDFIQPASLGGLTANQSLPWDGTMRSIETPSFEDPGWRLHARDVKESPDLDEEDQE